MQLLFVFYTNFYFTPTKNLEPLCFFSELFHSRICFLFASLSRRLETTCYMLFNSYKLLYYLALCLTQRNCTPLHCIYYSWLYYTAVHRIELHYTVSTSSLCTVSVLGREEGYTVKYILSTREMPRGSPRDFPRAQALFYRRSLLSS